MLFQAIHASFLLADNLIDQETGYNIIYVLHTASMDYLPLQVNSYSNECTRSKYEINCFKVALVMF